MARLAQTKASTERSAGLAVDIIDAHNGEISVMKTIRRDMHDMETHGEDHMGMSDSDMGMDAAISRWRIPSTASSSA